MNSILDGARDAVIPTRMTKASIADGWNEDRRYERSLFHFCLKEECPNFRITRENEEVLNALYYYSLGLDDELDPKKGIWFWGDIGTGKSTLLRVLASFHRHLSYLKRTTPEGEVLSYAAQGFRVHNCARVAAEFASYGLPAVEPLTHNEGNPFTVGFDEMGREPNPIKHYGMEIDIMSYILQLRYEHRHRCLTHVSSNLNPEGVLRLYGAYIQDRVREMFNLIQLRGKSWRN